MPPVPIEMEKIHHRTEARTIDQVPRSATEGWDYGPGGKTIQLSGTWCTSYQNGMIKDVQTIFGCPGVRLIQRV